MSDDFYEEDQPLEDILAAWERAAKGVTEPLRRKIAQRHRDEVIANSGAPVKPKLLDTISSVRMSADLTALVRDRANELGVKTSDLLRAGAEYASMSGGGNGTWFTSFAAHCGCDMQPVYATT
jgi:hypothetical protein